jgi:hypothetical protein
MSRDSVIGAVLLFVVRNYVWLDPENRSRERSGRRAAHMFEEAYGDTPNMEVRLGFGRGPFAFFLLGSIGFTVVSLALFFAGTVLDAAWLRYSAALPAVFAGMFLGQACALSTRGVLVGTDYRRWVAAGRPQGWIPSRRSQARTLDVVWGAVIGAAFAWFYLTLMFQP